MSTSKLWWILTLIIVDWWIMYEMSAQQNMKVNVSLKAKNYWDEYKKKTNHLYEVKIFFNNLRF
jgi:hypothetical protein